MRLRVAVLVLLMVMASFPLLSTPATAAPAPCSKGHIALTFDDGPSPAQTPRLLDILGRLKVRATFFLVGERVAARPGLARQVLARGHVVANHTWSHPRLTALGDGAVRSQVERTRRALKRANAAPSRLMRPPFGAINPRVRKVIAKAGLVPVLWDVDTRDWESGTPRQIADRVLSRLRPHGSNIVLQHDGVRRSPDSVSAVERIVRQARSRGYCFVGLGNDGRPAPAMPIVQVSTVAGQEQPNRPVVVKLHLDRPTSRPVSVVVATTGASATVNRDFTNTRVRVVFPPGVRDRTVTIPVLDDILPEGVETVRASLWGPVGLRFPVRHYFGEINSDDTLLPGS